MSKNKIARNLGESFRYNKKEFISFYIFLIRQPALSITNDVKKILSRRRKRMFLRVLNGRLIKIQGGSTRRRLTVKIVATTEPRKLHDPVRSHYSKENTWTGNNGAHKNDRAIKQRTKQGNDATIG